MLDCHINAWLCQPGKVLGKKLQPFTVGHLFLLEAAESPYVTGGSVRLFDTIFAVMLCSLPFDKARELVMMPEHKILAMAQRWGFWCRITRRDIPRATDAFRDYIEAYTAFPEMWKDPEKKGRDSALPFSVRVAWTVMERASEEEVWNMPLARALAYFAAQCENSGNVEFVTEREMKVGL